MHTLVKGLEKIAASADIPMLVAGDFNSIPGSAAHSLLVKHSVDADHPVGSRSSPCDTGISPNDEGSNVSSQFQRLPSPLFCPTGNLYCNIML